MRSTCSCCGIEAPTVVDKCAAMKDYELCRICYFAYQDELTNGKSKDIQEFLQRTEIRNYSNKFNMTEELTQRILDRKFEAMSLDELLLTVKVLPKMGMYDSIFLITECFTRIFAKFHELDVNSQKPCC